MVSFYDIIQAYFTQMTGRFVMFSGRDMALLHRWRQQGATPASVCRGIREAVLHMTKEPPRSIYNCRVFIEPHVERARQRLIDDGQDQEGEDEDDTLNHAMHQPRAEQARREPVASRSGVLRGALSVLEAAGRQCQDEAVRALYREMWYRVRSLHERELTASVEAQYEQLLRLEEELAESYYAALGLAEQRQIDELLGQEEAELGLSVRMSPDAWSRHRTARKNRVLARDYGMISLLK